MKKKGILSLFAIVACLTLVGCDKSSSDVKTLECTAKGEAQEITMIIKQDQKTYKFTEVTMKSTADKSIYDDFGLSNKELEEMMCDDTDNQYKSCSVKFEKDKVIATIEMNVDKYEKQILDDSDMKIKKLDKDTLTKLKESTEKESTDYTCKIS